MEFSPCPAVLRAFWEKLVEKQGVGSISDSMKKHRQWFSSYELKKSHCYRAVHPPGKYSKRTVCDPAGLMRENEGQHFLTAKK